ncbi:IS1595 family transposase [Massilia arenosa]|uniref:IS1595 family transposase n=1 Tax=Zemynaea arenosa TaxID=2561931 RepID=A0A4Y9SMX4_9BURK|nr:IS1595 family transposase [Massilia arenosa]TFW26275.1 IS1595 family transposase [Massilia arenosa]
MRKSDFEVWLEGFKRLTRTQRAHVLALMRAAEPPPAAQLLEDAGAPVLACPACRGHHLHRHGHKSQLQRYRCVDCGRTFNSLTGTPMARLRLKDNWLAYCKALLRSDTVRRAAVRVGVHKNTAFRWRHRFLTLPKTDRPFPLHGIAEADELFLRESEKGARHLERPPRKRGGAATKRGISREQVCIVVARDRAGQTVDFIAGKGPVTKLQLHRGLAPILAPDALLVTDANASYRYFAQERGFMHQWVNLKAGERVKGAVHIQNVNAYHSRFRGWLSNFHGVATHYLSNYLGWRWALDKSRIDDPAVLLRATVGAFSHT